MGRNVDLVQTLGIDHHATCPKCHQSRKQMFTDYAMGSDTNPAPGEWNIWCGCAECDHEWKIQVKVNLHTRIEKDEPGLFGEIFCPWCSHPLVLEYLPDEEKGPYNYQCTNENCTWKYGGLLLHHALDSKPMSDLETVKPNFTRAPSIDFWSLSFIK